MSEHQRQRDVVALQNVRRMWEKTMPGSTAELDALDRALAHLDRLALTTGAADICGHCWGRVTTDTFAHHRASGECQAQQERNERERRSIGISWRAISMTMAERGGDQ